jgi:hypothetical protein
MDFFATHPHYLWAIFGFAFFPRITLWFFATITGGFGFWLGVFFVPHIMIAYWATYYYFDTNPILCILAWMVALGGSSTEKKAIQKRIK